MMRAWLAVALAGSIPVAAVSQADRVAKSSTSVAAESNLAGDNSWVGMPQAELLAKQLQCAACHTATGVAAERLAPVHAPSLAGIGDRRSPGWIASYLSRADSPHPKVVSGDAAQAQQYANAIATELMRGSELAVAGRETNAEEQATGAVLFQELGCFACHDDNFAGRDLAGAWGLAELSAALHKPNAHLSLAGRMPDLMLEPEQADAISAWLLREQVADGPEEAIPGLSYAYYEEPNWPAEGLDFDSLTPVAHGTAKTVTHTMAKRNQHFGLVLTGVLLVEESGEYQFWTRSDDGSELYLDGERLVDNLGHHAPITKQSSLVSLEAGRHELRITFFENAGGEELSAGWSGPGFEQRAFNESELAHMGRVPRRAPREFTAADGGADLMKAFNCAACHDPGSPVNALPGSGDLRFAALPAEATGCLSEQVVAGLPNFELQASERDQLINLLRNRSDLMQARSPEEEVYVHMTQHQCTSCHARDGVGEPAAATLAMFVGADDLGEEGRVPPTLHDVGAKLKEGVLGHAIAHGQEYRPSVRARMPAFGDVDQQLSHQLTAAFRSIDTAPKLRAAPNFSAEDAKLGHRLTGTQGGLACIACHGANGNPSVGVQGPSLSEMAERLEFDWYARWMADPTKVRPGTRMLNVFGSGRSPIADVHGGDAAKQIDAIWQYLSLGESMPLPAGLVPEAGAYALIPTDEPLYFGTFYRDASARVMAVGFPERVSVAFDMYNVRLFEAWRGDFMDARGTWDGRAGQLESAAGSDILQLPSPLVMYAGQDLPETGRGLYQMLGHDRDARGYPTFRYRLNEGDVEIAESIRPQLAEGGARLVRSVELRAPVPVAELVIRTVEPGQPNKVRLVPVDWEFDPDTQTLVFRYEEELQW